MAERPLTLANCDSREELNKVQARLHPVTDRRTLIFAAGVLGNTKLLKGLGSQESSTFYDGMVAAGLLDANPYWRDIAERNARGSPLR